MLLRPSPVSSRLFSYDTKKKIFVGEISDLGKGFTFGRVYDDSADEGFTMVSQWTGKEVVFILSRRVEDTREGEIIGWEFTPAPGQNLKHFLKVTLYND